MGSLFKGKVNTKQITYIPTVLTAFGNTALVNWFVNAFKPNEIVFLGDHSEVNAFKEAALTQRPDVLVILREGADGRGLPAANQVALWGRENFFDVILVVGVKDGEWTAKAQEATDADVFVISWDEGVAESGYLMINLVKSICKEIRNSLSKKQTEPLVQAATEPVDGIKELPGAPDGSPPKKEVGQQKSVADEPLEQLQNRIKDRLSAQKLKAEPPPGDVKASETDKAPARLRLVPNSADIEVFPPLSNDIEEEPALLQEELVTKESEATFVAGEEEGKLPELAVNKHNQTVLAQGEKIENTSERAVSEPQEKIAVDNRILLATGHEEIDAELKRLLPNHAFNVVGECYSRQALTPMFWELRPETVIISPYLGGGADVTLVAIIRIMRENGVRVMVLPGDAQAKSTRALQMDLIPLGVYDFVYDLVSGPAILNRLKHPANLGDLKELGELALAEQEINSEMAASVLPDLVREDTEDKKPAGGLLNKVRGVAGKLAGAINAKDVSNKPEEPIKRFLLDKFALPKRSVLPKLPALPKKPVKEEREELLAEGVQKRFTVRAQNPVEQVAEYKYHGILAANTIVFVSPWRPGLSGQLAAAAARMFESVEGRELAVVCASVYSTAAERLGVEINELIMSDWRVPGSQGSLLKGNVRVFATDPAKDIRTQDLAEMRRLITSVQENYGRVLIDCADDRKLAREFLLYQDAAIMYVVPGADSVEQRVARVWLNHLSASRNNIACGVDMRGYEGQIPDGINAELIIRESPDKAIWDLIRKKRITAVRDGIS